MRTAITGVLVLLLASTAPLRGQDDRAKLLADQKKQAEASWESLDIGPAAMVESPHLVVFAPLSLEKRLKPIAALLEKYHDRAVKALAMDAKEGYPGRITVYLLEEPLQLSSFARRVEKRRPMGLEPGCYSATDAMLHVAVTPGKGKIPIPVEVRAGEYLAALLLQRSARVSTALPDWLIQGFGRATSYQVLPPADRLVASDRKQARGLVRKHSAEDVWDRRLDAEDADCLQGSLAEFLAYGPGATRFGKFVQGFQPGEGRRSRTTEEAIKAAGLSADRVGKLWKSRVR